MEGFRGEPRRSPEYASKGNELLGARDRDESYRDVYFESFMAFICGMKEAATMKERGIYRGKARKLVMNIIPLDGYIPKFVDKILDLKKSDPDNYISALRMYQHTRLLVAYLALRKFRS